MSADGNEWRASDYARHSMLQEAMAAEVLERLPLNGDERVLDVGCGDGRVSARIADRLADGSVLGVDASADMIAFATAHYGAGGDEPRSNLRFAIADARALHYPSEFDLVVSSNALHWVPMPGQAAALRGIAATLKPWGRAQLRLVVKGEIASLEELAEQVRQRPRWSAHFESFADPYLRLDAAQYAALAEQQGLRVLAQRTKQCAWEFKTHGAFVGFCRAGFGAWTRQLPAGEQGAFIDDVIAAYREAAALGDANASLFRFYQMDITLG